MPHLETNQSGNHILVLASDISALDFPSLAQKWAKDLNLQLGEMASGGNEIVWPCSLGKYKFWISSDIWFPNLSLEPQDLAASNLIKELSASLGASATLNDNDSPLS